MKIITRDYFSNYVNGKIKIHKLGSSIRPQYLKSPLLSFNQNIQHYYIPIHNFKKVKNLLWNFFIPWNCHVEFWRFSVSEIYLPTFLSSKLQKLFVVMSKKYNQPAAKIRFFTLQTFRHACTTELPFYDHKRNIFARANGIRMRTSLDPTIFKYFCHNKVFD